MARFIRQLDELEESRVGDRIAYTLILPSSVDSEILPLIDFTCFLEWSSDWSLMD